MTILNRVSAKIDTLNSGEQWVITAQDLWMSRSDFHSLSVYLSRESMNGHFSVQTQEPKLAWLGATSLKVIKN